MKFFIHTYGCQMNVRDSEAVCALLEAAGHAQVETEAEAELVVVNSCTVRQKSDYFSNEDIGSFGESGGDPAPAGGQQSGPVSETPSELEALIAEQDTDEGRRYHYEYAVGENGYLLLADGTESDVLPVLNRGELACGVRGAGRMEEPAEIYRMLAK